MLISVDWLPPYFCPSRRLLRSRDEDRGLITSPKIAPIPGPRLPPMTRDRDQDVGASFCSRLFPSGRQRDRAGDRPGEGGHLSGNGHDDLVGVLAPGEQATVAFAQAYLRLPADGLDFRGQLLQPKLKMPADLGRVPIGPGAFDERAPGVG